MTTYLDRFPVELLQLIFQYMSANDIIWSFLEISPYLDVVLESSCWDRLDFRSIPKRRFDYLCTRLDCQKLLSLTLSDDQYTPGQVQLFFNRFRLRDIRHLRSLTLLSVTNEDIYPLLFDLPYLKSLTSLFTKCRSSQPLLLGQTLNQLQSLEKLSVSHGDIFDHTVSIPLRRLKVLDAGTCDFLELRRLQMVVPALVSLKIILHANHQLQLSSDFDSWLSLKRLDLTLTGEAIVSCKEVQAFLVQLQNLTDLTFHIRGSADDLANGTTWETCPSIVRLRRFHFRIDFEQPFADSNQPILRIFDSFSTPFWIDLKRWYVAVTTHRVYTISQFDQHLFMPSTSPSPSTSPDARWFYSQVKRIKIDHDTSLINLARFEHLEELEFNAENSFSSIRNIKGFPHLHHLTFHCSISKIILEQLLAHNPQINALTLSVDDKLSQFSPLESIRSLHIRDTIRITHRSQIKQLSRVFPKIEKLSIHLKTNQLVRRIIDSFPHLINAVFYFHEVTKPLSPEWFKENTRLMNNAYSFTCRNEPNRLLLWINDSVGTAVSSQDKSQEMLNSSAEQRTEKCLLQ